MELRCTSPCGAVTLMPAPSPAAVTSPLPELTVTCADLGTVTVRFSRPLSLLSDLTSTALPLTVRCARLGVEDFFGVGVRAGEGHLVGLHFDGGSVARGHAHVAARILDLDGGVGGNLRVQHLLVVVVLGQAEGVEEVVVRCRSNWSNARTAAVVPSGGADAQKGQQDEDAHKAAAAAHGSFAAQVERPLAQQGQAGDDQQQRPPVAIPGPELAGSDVAGEHQQADHADADQDDRADDGGNARTVGADIAGLPWRSAAPSMHRAARARRPSAARGRRATGSWDRKADTAAARRPEACVEVRCS